MKSPIVTRKTAQRYVREAVRECEDRNSELRRGLADMAKRSRDELRAEFDRKALPVLRRMVDASAEHRAETGDFVLHFNLDRRMLEQAAMSDDRIVWEHISQMIARHIERELATMNFAGLQRMASDFDRRYRPPVRYALPSTALDFA